MPATTDSAFIQFIRENFEPYFCSRCVTTIYHNPMHGQPGQVPCPNCALTGQISYANRVAG